MIASSAPNPVAESSRLTLLQKKLHDRGTDHSKKEATKIPHITTESNKIQAHRYIFDEDEGFECPEHYYLEKVQERLEKCDISSSPFKKNLVDIMIMLSILPADITGLSIDKYDTSDEMWYKSNYNPIRVKELLTWIQNAIPEKFTFLQKNHSGIVNVNPINTTIAEHRITSRKLRVIGADHASKIHGVEMILIVNICEN
ncbi:unnamed protein product [Rhizophagus irregularis]|nr:unnamed protein product [Rhizophagus irregularis]